MIIFLLHISISFSSLLYSTRLYSIQSNACIGNRAPEHQIRICFKSSKDLQIINKYYCKLCEILQYDKASYYNSSNNNSNSGSSNSIDPACRKEFIVKTFIKKEEIKNHLIMLKYNTDTNAKTNTSTNNKYELKQKFYDIYKSKNKFDENKDISSDKNFWNDESKWLLKAENTKIAQIIREDIQENTIASIFCNQKSNSNKYSNNSNHNHHHHRSNWNFFSNLLSSLSSSYYSNSNSNTNSAADWKLKAEDLVRVKLRQHYSDSSLTTAYLYFECRNEEEMKKKREELLDIGRIFVLGSSCQITGLQLPLYLVICYGLFFLLLIILLLTFFHTFTHTLSISLSYSHKH